ncbi:hypothetical protein RSOL_448750 [Rhizoctonia solani AG-3 Rhs1AP]|uniref:Uncharacterized protein n=2 Tax=Rhizoctonia solani AG-3 TaxID=1086053 RepID=A0A074RV68_9AGAM|nr:hypothetical protein RSOL_448750 [Rhizoctonia solani AG-3 Rhs1AP]KEP51021.1 hypothetical protein V565_068810 [Rhizoctonia solani 123E]
MVHSFSLALSHSYALRVFHRLIGRALSNMTGLDKLSIHSSFPICSALSRISCQLTELLYSSLSSDSYPISDFLSTQPTIEKLVIVCQADSLSNLDPKALPGLRDLSAAVELCSTSLISHLSRLSRLFILHPMTHIVQFVELAGALQETTSPRPLELSIGIDTSTEPEVIETVTLGLAYIGSVAPFITSLKLIIYQGYMQQDELHDMFQYTLPKFPNLKMLTVISPPPTQNMYPRGFQMRKLSHTISLIHGALYLLDLPIDTAILPASESEQGQPNPNALYDKSCHTKIICAWGQIHTGLEYVVFPLAMYDLKAFRSA